MKKNRYVLVGAITGNVNSCIGGLPDIYNFVGNEKILNWVLSQIVPEAPAQEESATTILPESPEESEATTILPEAPEESEATTILLEAPEESEAPGPEDPDTDTLPSFTNPNYCPRLRCSRQCIKKNCRCISRFPSKKCFENEPTFGN